MDRADSAGGITKKGEHGEEMEEKDTISEVFYSRNYNNMGATSV